MKNTFTGKNEDQELRVLNSIPYKYGLKDVRYEQYYKGIKVEHAAITVHIKNGQVTSITGVYHTIPSSIQIQPTLSLQEALEYAKQFITAKKYGGELKTEENIPDGELVICEKSKISEYI